MRVTQAQKYVAVNLGSDEKAYVMVDVGNGEFVAVKIELRSGQLPEIVVTNPAGGPANATVRVDEQIGV